MNNIQPLNTSASNKAAFDLKNKTIALLTNTNSLKQTIGDEFEEIERKESKSTVSKNTEKADYLLAWALQIEEFNQMCSLKAGASNNAPKAIVADSLVVLSSEANTLKNAENVDLKILNDTISQIETISKSMATATPSSIAASNSQAESPVQNNTIPKLIDKYEKARLEEAKLKEAKLKEARRSQSQSSTPNLQVTAGSSIQFPTPVEWLRALVGSKYEKREIVGDGNCFLHAMSQIIIEQARGSNEERKNAVKQFFVDNDEIQNILNSINNSNSGDQDLQKKLTPIIRKKLVDYVKNNANYENMLSLSYHDVIQSESTDINHYISQLSRDGQWLGLETLPFVRNIFNDILSQNDLGCLFLGENVHVASEGLTADNLPPYVLENTTGTHWTIYVKTPNAT